MTTKSSWPRLNPPAAGRLSNTPTTSNRWLPTRTSLPIGSTPSGSNSSLYGGVAEHDDVPAILQLGAVEVAAGEDRNARAGGEVLRRAEDDQRLGLEVAIEDPLLGDRSRAGPELQIDVLERRPLLLERARIGQRQVGPFQQLR